MPLKSNFVFCDGACSGNPGPGGWGSIVITMEDKVTEIGGHEAQSTNNRMELTATLESLRFLEKVTGDIAVCTDSQYVIKGITEWIKGWQRRNWKNSQNEPVANRPLWEAIEGQTKVIQAQGRKIKWVYVKGHSGHVGNDRADEIAVSFSVRQSLSLFKGNLSEYPLSLTFSN